MSLLLLPAKAGLVSNPWELRGGVRLGFNIFASFVPKATWRTDTHTWYLCRAASPFTLQVVFFPFAGKVSPFAPTFWGGKDGEGKFWGFFGSWEVVI